MIYGCSDCQRLDSENKKLKELVSNLLEMTKEIPDYKNITFKELTKESQDCTCGNTSCDGSNYK